MDSTLLIFSRATDSASFLKTSCSVLAEFLMLPLIALITAILSDCLLPVFLVQLPVPDRSEAICCSHSLTVVPNTVLAHGRQSTNSCVNLLN